MQGYNGYSEKQRNKIMGALKRAKQVNGDWAYRSPCSICLDPERHPRSWHSEDYSEPFVLEPPATYPICFTCHGRLHKRFSQPLDWQLYLEHLKRGGYGREFIAWYPKKDRDAYIGAIATGHLPALPHGRSRPISGDEWWLHLTLDAESLHAPWARPRPLRPYPDGATYLAALNEVRPSDQEISLLRANAARPRRCASMGDLAKLALVADRAQTANMLYGKLAHRLADALRTITGFRPDLRENGSPIWMSAVAEGWQPGDRGYEWVMVPFLAEAVAVLPASNDGESGLRHRA